MMNNQEEMVCALCFYPVIILRKRNKWQYTSEQLKANEHTPRFECLPCGLKYYDLWELKFQEDAEEMDA